MADKKVEIGISTKLTGTGAQDAGRELGKVDGAASAAGRSMDVMEQEARDLEKALRALAPGTAEFEQTAVQLGQVRRAMEDTNRLADDYAVKAGGAAVANRNFGSTATQVGFQVQDFAVQVGSGTNALTAFAQQGSQLLGMFGPQGAILGALVAVGAAVYNGLSAAGEQAKEDTENAEKLGEAIRTLKSRFDEFQGSRAKVGKENLADVFEREKEEIEGATAAVLRNIEQLKNREILAGRIRDAQIATEIAAVDAAEQAGTLSAAEAKKQRDELERRQAQDEIRRLGVLSDLQQQASEAKLAAAAKELAAAKRALDTAAQQEEAVAKLKQRFEQLAAAADALGKIKALNEAGGRGEGFALEPAIDIERRRRELDRLEPIAAAPNGIIPRPGQEDAAAAIVAAELEKVKAALEGLPETTEGVRQAFEDARAAFQAAQAATGEQAAAAAGEASVRSQEELQAQIEALQPRIESSSRDAADAVAKAFEQWVASLGASAEQGRPNELIEQVRAALADGIQDGELAKISQQAAAIAASVNKVTSTSSAAFSIVQSVIGDQERRMDQILRELQSLRDAVSDLSKRR